MKKYIALLSIFFLAFSCMEDLGSYEYNEINEVTITLETTYNVYQSASPNIVPTISQSMEDNEDNLKYCWIRDATGDTICETRNFDEVIYYNIGDEEIHYYVTDTKTGIFAYAECDFMVNGFNGTGLAILGEKNGQAILSYVGDNAEGDARIDIFEGEGIGANPLAIDYHNPDADFPRLSIFCNDENGGVILNPTDFNYLHSYADFFHTPLDVINPQFMSQVPDYGLYTGSAQSYYTTGSSNLIVNDGKVYPRYLSCYIGDNDSIYVGDKYFDHYVAPDDKGTYITNAFYYYGVQGLCFDELNGRFLQFPTSYQASFNEPSTYSTHVQEFDYLNMGAGYKCVYGAMAAVESANVPLFYILEKDNEYYLCRIEYVAVASWFWYNYYFRAVEFRKVESSEMNITSSTEFQTSSLRDALYFSDANNLMIYDPSSDKSVVLYGDIPANETIVDIFNAPTTTDRTSFDSHRIYVATKDNTDTTGLNGHIYVLEVTINTTVTLIRKIENVSNDIVDLTWIKY